MLRKLFSNLHELVSRGFYKSRTRRIMWPKCWTFARSSWTNKGSIKIQGHIVSWEQVCSGSTLVWSQNGHIGIVGTKGSQCFQIVTGKKRVTRASIHARKSRQSFRDHKTDLRFCMSTFFASARWHLRIWKRLCHFLACVSNHSCSVFLIAGTRYWLFQWRIAFRRLTGVPVATKFRTAWQSSKCWSKGNKSTIPLTWVSQHTPVVWHACWKTNAAAESRGIANALARQQAILVATVEDKRAVKPSSHRSLPVAPSPNEKFGTPRRTFAASYCALFSLEATCDHPKTWLAHASIPKSAEGPTLVLSCSTEKDIPKPSSCMWLLSWRVKATYFLQAVLSKLSKASCSSTVTPRMFMSETFRGWFLSLVEAKAACSNSPLIDKIVGPLAPVANWWRHVWMNFWPASKTRLIPKQVDWREKMSSTNWKSKWFCLATMSSPSKNSGNLVVSGKASWSCESKVGSRFWTCSGRTLSSTALEKLNFRKCWLMNEQGHPKLTPTQDRTISLVRPLLKASNKWTAVLFPCPTAKVESGSIGPIRDPTRMRNLSDEKEESWSNQSLPWTLASHKCTRVPLRQVRSNPCSKSCLRIKVGNLQVCRSWATVIIDSATRTASMRPPCWWGPIYCSSLAWLRRSQAASKSDSKSSVYDTGLKLETSSTISGPRLRRGVISRNQQDGRVVNLPIKLSKAQFMAVPGSPPKRQTLLGNLAEALEGWSCFWMATTDSQLTNSPWSSATWLNAFLRQFWTASSTIRLKPVEPGCAWIALWRMLSAINSSDSAGPNVSPDSALGRFSCNATFGRNMVLSSFWAWGQSCWVNSCSRLSFLKLKTKSISSDKSSMFQPLVSSLFWSIRKNSLIWLAVFAACAVPEKFCLVAFTSPKRWHAIVYNADRHHTHWSSNFCLSLFCFPDMAKFLMFGQLAIAHAHPATKNNDLLTSSNAVSQFSPWIHLDVPVLWVCITSSWRLDTVKQQQAWSLERSVSSKGWIVMDACKPGETKAKSREVPDTCVGIWAPTTRTRLKPFSLVSKQRISLSIGLASLASFEDTCGMWRFRSPTKIRGASKYWGLCLIFRYSWSRVCQNCLLSLSRWLGGKAYTPSNKTTIGSAPSCRLSVTLAQHALASPKSASEVTDFEASAAVKMATESGFEGSFPFKLKTCPGWPLHPWC